MNKSELAKFIAEFVMYEKDTILEAFEKDDISIIEDGADAYIDNCQ